MGIGIKGKFGTVPLIMQNLIKWMSQGICPLRVTDLAFNSEISGGLPN